MKDEVNFFFYIFCLIQLKVFVKLFINRSFFHFIVPLIYLFSGGQKEYSTVKELPMCVCNPVSTYYQSKLHYYSVLRH